MASEFSSLSTPESDDSTAAVDALVSQAIDASVLEAVAKLNLSHVQDSSSIPANLETRFQKLKSFPVTDTSTRWLGQSKGLHTDSIKETVIAEFHTPTQACTEGDMTQTQPQSQSPPNLNDDSSSSLPTNLETSPTNGRLNQSSSMHAEAIHESVTLEFHAPNRDHTEVEIMSSPNLDDYSSPSLSSARPLSESPSPPRRVCCFGSSSSKVVKKKPKDKQRQRVKNDEILTDFSTFSFKEQQKNLKKALREEEKVSRDAAKVAEWVKQASARMDVSVVDDLLSEDEKHDT